MQTGNPILDDLARVASGAFSALGGVREEVETRVKERLERLAGEMDLATREELDAVKAMALKARGAQEAIDARLDRLEAEIREIRHLLAAGAAPTATPGPDAGDAPAAGETPTTP